MRCPGRVYPTRNKDIYKTGTTISIRRRLKRLKLDEALEVMQITNTREAEKAPHDRFKYRRIPQSEYFRLTAEEIEEVRSLFRPVRGEESVGAIKARKDAGATVKKA